MINLERSVQAVTADALCILQGSSGTSFHFESGGLVSWPNADLPSAMPGNAIKAFLMAEKEKSKCDRLIGVLQKPIESNGFSKAACGEGVTWVTTHDWEFYSDLPLKCYLAYQLVWNELLMRLPQRPEEESWLMKEVQHTAEAWRCIAGSYDFKADLAKGIRSGSICPACCEIIGEKLGAECLRDAQSALQAIRTAAVPLAITNSLDDFPALKFMHLRASADYRRNGSQPGPDELKDQHAEAVEDARLLSPELEEEDAVRYCIARRRKPSLFEYDEGDLAQANGTFLQVERRYPFPIAYCFRSLRAETAPIDKWLALYDLYKLVIRYIVFFLLAEARSEKRSIPQGLFETIHRLVAAGDGLWGKACFELLRFYSDEKAGSWTADFIERVLETDLNDLIWKSKCIVKERNDQHAHGFKGDAALYTRCFEQHLPAVKQLLALMHPITQHVLICPIQIISHCEGECLFIAKVLMGSNPMFISTELHDTKVPETVCQLVNQDTFERLSLYPFMHLDRCSECRRDMVFLFDRVEQNGSEPGPILREYPYNHTKARTDIEQAVQKGFGVK